MIEKGLVSLVAYFNIYIFFFVEKRKDIYIDLGEKREREKWRTKRDFAGVINKKKKRAKKCF